VAERRYVWPIRFPGFSSPERFVVVHKGEDVTVEEDAERVTVKMPLCEMVDEEIKCEPEGYVMVFEKGVPGPKEIKYKYPK